MVGDLFDDCVDSALLEGVVDLVADDCLLERAADDCCEDCVDHFCEEDCDDCCESLFVDFDDFLVDCEDWNEDNCEDCVDDCCEDWVEDCVDLDTRGVRILSVGTVSTDSRLGSVVSIGHVYMVCVPVFTTGRRFTLSA